jgi:hypothetical protein
LFIFLYLALSGFSGFSGRIVSWTESASSLLAGVSSYWQKQFGFFYVQAISQHSGLWGSFMAILVRLLKHFAGWKSAAIRAGQS